MTIGDRVKRARWLMEWTQEELAYSIGKSRVAIVNIEGNKQNLTVKTLRSICDALGVSADWVLGR